MNELWVARDRASGAVRVYERQPTESYMHFAAVAGGVHILRSDPFPDLKPGECRRLVLAEETSE